MPRYPARRGRGGRAVEGGALEKRRVERLRGFESHPLRHRRFGDPGACRELDPGRLPRKRLFTTSLLPQRRVLPIFASWSVARTTPFVGFVLCPRSKTDVVRLKRACQRRTLSRDLPAAYGSAQPVQGHRRDLPAPDAGRGPRSVRSSRPRTSDSAQPGVGASRTSLTLRASSVGTNGLARKATLVSSTPCADSASPA